jgi:hypothetical protein
MLKSLPSSLAPLSKAMVRAASRSLRGGDVLGPPAQKANAAIATTEMLATEINAAFVASLSDAERQAPEAMLVHLETYLETGRDLRTGRGFACRAPRNPQNVLASIVKA